jgi:hypothetical protein
MIGPLEWARTLRPPADTDRGEHGRPPNCKVIALRSFGEFHVSMLRISFGPWQLTRANSQGDV